IAPVAALIRSGVVWTGAAGGCAALPAPPCAAAGPGLSAAHASTAAATVERACDPIALLMSSPRLREWVYERHHRSRGPSWPGIITQPSGERNRCSGARNAIPLRGTAHVAHRGSLYPRRYLASTRVIGAGSRLPAISRAECMLSIALPTSTVAIPSSVE